MPGILSRLRLRHFRNYDTLDLRFAPGVSVLTGPNGQGKTNLLEAIYYSSLLRSFRTQRTADLRQWDASSFFLEADLENEHDPLAAERLSVTYADQRHLRVDGVEVARASAFINHLLCVAFVPEDIELIKGPPADRRRFVDICLCQLSDAYLSHLAQYQAALKARNAMLKDPRRFGRSSRRAYEKHLAQHGAEVTIARRGFLRLFATNLRDVGTALFPSNLEIGLEYRSQLMQKLGDGADVVAVSDLFRRQLDAEAETVSEFPTTRVGPHRDDIRLRLNNRPADVYGSEGQCRLLSLALRLAFVPLLLESRPERELVLLVDDVFGELDGERRRHFFQQLGRGRQIFIACTEVPPELSGESVCIFEVNNGTVTSPRHKSTY